MLSTKIAPWGLLIFTTSCAPIQFVSKKTHKELATTFAQGRKVQRPTTISQFNLVSPQDITLHSSQAPEFVSDRQKALFSNSSSASWVLINPHSQLPVSRENLASSLLAEIEQHYDDYALKSGELVPLGSDVQVSDRLVAISFGRQIEGTSVRDAYIQGIFWQDDQGLFRLREVVNQSYGDLAPTNSQSLISSWSDLQSVLPEGEIIPVTQKRVLISRPEQLASTQEEVTALQLVYATEFVYQKPDDTATYTLTLEDGSLQVLEGFSSQYHVAMPLQASVYKRTYLETAQVAKPLFEMPVLAQNNQLTTDIDGLVDIGNATSVTLRLQSGRVTVLPRQGNAVVQVVATPTVTNGNLVVTTTGDNLTALNTFTSVIEVNRFTRRHLVETDSRFLTQPTAVRFNVRGNCNAFYDSQASAISLFAAGNGCANVALINDVTYHEWGHGLDNFTGVNVGITDGAFSEAIGDIVAAYLTGSPVTAPGFLVNDPTGIRNLDNQKIYPGSLQNEVHADGEIVGAAFWHMRQNLIARYGANAGAVKAENLFMRHLLTTDSYLQSYQSVIRLDDNDGNPMTKSPNHCLINASFAMHGLATAENCQDDATPSAVPVDMTAAIAVSKNTETGIILMASTEKGRKMAICFESKETCLAQSNLQADLVTEGSLDQKVIFVTKDPLPSLKPLSTVTLIIKGSDNKPVGTRSFKLSLK